MTRKDAIARRAELERRRDALVDQLTALDAASASVSSGAGSRSYTNRAVADVKAKIAFVDAEIARLDHRLGNGSDPSAPRAVRITFNG